MLVLFLVNVSGREFRSEVRGHLNLSRGLGGVWVLTQLTECSGTFCFRSLGSVSPTHKIEPSGPIVSKDPSESNVTISPSEGGTEDGKWSGSGEVVGLVTLLMGYR